MNYLLIKIKIRLTYENININYKFQPPTKVNMEFSQNILLKFEE